MKTIKHWLYEVMHPLRGVDDYFNRLQNLDMDGAPEFRDAKKEYFELKKQRDSSWYW